MVGEACLPSNAYYPRTPDYTLCSGIHVCWSEHSDSSFVYGFMILDYGFGTMTATTITRSDLWDIYRTLITDRYQCDHLVSILSKIKNMIFKRRYFIIQEALCDIYGDM